MKKLPVVVLVGVSVLFGSFVGALEVQGNVAFWGRYSLLREDFDYGMTVDVSSTVSLSDKYFGSMDFLLRYQDEENVRPFRIREVSLQGIQVPWETTDFRVGLLEMAWGASDVMSPIDVLNPRPFSRDLSDAMLGEKIPVPAFDFEWYLSDAWSLEIFCQPYFVAHFIPEPVEKQLLVSSLLPFGVAPERTNVVLVKKEPPVSFAHPIWAVRARGSLGSFDIALSYVESYFLSAYPKETVISSLPEGVWNVQIHSGYPKRSILGFEFQGTLAGVEGLTLRGDVAWIVPERWVNTVTLPEGGRITIPIFEAPYWKASLGMDYSWDNVYLSVAYLLGSFWEEGENVSSYGYVHVDWQSENGRWKPFANWVTSIEDGSMVWVVGTEYKLEDSWNLTFRYTFSRGSSESRLGGVGEEVYLEVKHSF